MNGTTNGLSMSLVVEDTGKGRRHDEERS